MSTAPERLRVEDHPLEGEVAGGRWVGVALTPRPRLSWVVPLRRRGQEQTAHRVRVSAEGTDPRDPAVSAWWDSGCRTGTGVREPWAGPDLEPHGCYRWTVRCWDEHGVPGAWAAPVPLHTGPFTARDWTAQWVDVPGTHLARGEVSLPRAAVLARLHVTAQGLVRAVLDDVPVNGDSADPSRTTPRRSLVRSYDVTDLLGAGRHVLDLVVAQGHAPGKGLVGLLAELVATLADGSQLRWGTGPEWLHTTSQVLGEEAFYLESHAADPAGRTPGGSDPGGSDPGGPDPGGPDPGGWAPVTPSPREELLVEPDPAPPLHVVRWLPAAESGRPGGTVRVHDVRTNVAGRSRLTVTGAPRGTRLRVVHGETLTDDGRVSTANIRLPRDRDRERQVLEHVCGGADPEVVQPWFAVHGFRYVEVADLPAAAQVRVEAGVLHSDVPVTGTFTCDDPLVERLVSAGLQTQLNNLHSLPEDCPTREQSGWTGDAAAAAPAACAHLDMSGLYRKWLRDLADDQRADGAVPGVTPAVTGTFAPPDPVWGAAYPVVLWQHWLHTGDPALVRDHLAGLGRWCDYQRGLLVEGLVRRAEISYGHDWLAPEQTPPVLLQSCAVVACLRTTAALEDACGDPVLARRRRQEAQEVVTAARDRLRDPVTGSWANGSQGSLALALTTGLARPEEVPRLRQVLRSAVRNRGERLSSGFAATAAVVRALAETDGGSALLACVHQGEQPGIGAMVVQGPGSFWETWWIDRDNVGVASLDHIGLAAPFVEWAWTHLAGLRPTGPGWSTFQVAPTPPAGLTRVEAQVRTVRGQVRSAWTREGDRLRLEVEVPVGCRATVRVPGGRTATVLADGVEIRTGDHPHLRGAHVSGEDLVVEAVAGSYLLEATGVLPPPSQSALGAVPDVPPGGTVEVPLLLGGDASGSWSAVAEHGWRAAVESRGDRSVLVIRAPRTAAVGERTPVRVEHDGVEVLRAVARCGRSGRWLGDGDQARGWAPGEPGTGVDWLPEGVVCEPVFHEPLPGPVLLVGGAPADPAAARSAVLGLDPPADLGDAAAVFAHVDFCVPAPPGRSVRVRLRVTSRDGSTVQSRATPLPVGWTRLGADVSDWPGARSVVRVEVVAHWVRVEGDPEPPGEMPFPVSFRLGRVGSTSAPLTW